jgi:lipopolysaccharide/colanic/teichoic acid biosynthesis glycosyltransferase
MLSGRMQIWHREIRRPGAVQEIAPSTNGATKVTAAADPGIGPGRARRILDVAVAIGVLTLVWPVLVMLVAAARLSTGGSAIYRQIRVGQGGVPFKLFKFRTMRAGMTGPEVTAPGDDRVTRLGALLRRAKIDELLQLVNVLRGDMTLVGPRPETLALAMRYPTQLKVVFRYRPGITGPSQVLMSDDHIQGEIADVEGYYLAELVPYRVGMDLDYLKDPTLARTIGWLVGTALYLIRRTRTRRSDAVQCAIAAEPTITETMVLGVTREN